MADKTTTDILELYAELSAEEKSEPEQVPYGWHGLPLVGSVPGNLSVKPEGTATTNLKVKSWKVCLNPEFSQAFFYYHKNSFNTAKKIYSYFDAIGHEKELNFSCEDFKCKLYRPLFSEVTENFLNIYFLNFPVKVIRCKA